MKEATDQSIPFLTNLEGIEALGLEPEEAFVLSRVNGKSSFEEIGKILGYDPARVWRSLLRAMEAGFVDIKEPETKDKPKLKRKQKSILEQLDEEDENPELSKISRSKRNEIRLRYQALENQNHYEVLGVYPETSIQNIKKQYFALSKEFHPDRLFKTAKGEYKIQLEKIFERITQAYEEISDPKRRKKYDQTLKGRKKEKEKSESSKPSSKTEVERLADAKRYFEIARKEEAQGNGLKAANFYQLALSFDPKNSEYAQCFKRVQPYLHRHRSEEVFRQASEALVRGDEEKAMELFEKTLELNPRKKECYRELAVLYLGSHKMLDRAREMGSRALDFFPDDPRVHSTMGFVYKKLGMNKLARKEFQVAVKLGETKKKVHRALEDLKGK